MKDSQSEKKKKRLFKIKKPSLKTSKFKTSSTAKKPQSLSSENTLLKKHEHNIFLLFIPIILGVILLIVYSINSHLQKELQANKLSQRLNSEKIVLPLLKEPIDPYLSAKAAIVLDSKTQTILFSKNPTLRFSTASTAKIMTALVAVENFRPDSELTIKSYRTEGTGIGLQFGDKFYFEDLMYAMMLPSANDAAAAIADNYPGGRSEFVKKMNEKAKSLHLMDTHFADSIGIDDDGNYSTVVDLARLSSVLMRNEYLAKIVSTQQKLIYNKNNTHPFMLTNLNRLLGYYGVNGVKTGTTEGAGEVLVTSSVVDGYTFIIVTMNSQDRFGDTLNILDLLSEQIDFVDIKSGI